MTRLVTSLDSDGIQPMISYLLLHPQGAIASEVMMKGKRKIVDERKAMQFSSKINKWIKKLLIQGHTDGHFNQLAFY